VAILGSTGSIGQSTLEVVAALPARFTVAGLVAHSRWRELAAQCHACRPRVAVLTDDASYTAADRTAFPPETELLTGTDAVAALVAANDVDVVVSAIVGSAGLHGTWEALRCGKRVALANKETLVVGGQLVMQLAAKTGALLLPVDSEHSAIAQAIGGDRAAVERVVLTASGGPFRGKTHHALEHVSVQEALNHPTWKMGPKITVDSATMMNKALEVIEARWLFDLAPQQIAVIVHPQSVVHSFVEFQDGSVLAQLSPPDMKLPIQYALTYPERLPGPAKRLPWAELSHLDFEQPDHATFPALDLGFEVAAKGGSCGAVLNAANEAAVQRFLDGELGFLDIARCCRAVLDHHHYEPEPTLEQLWQFDVWARQEVGRWKPTRTISPIQSSLR
jgi:1-deoxy-D-xylulose-5-phosphate reductoisomerase